MSKKVALSISSIPRQYLYGVATILIALLFSWLRLSNISNSLYFFSDMGRDFLEFYEWKTTGIPPLLGPQNSAIPFNQSPIYFYLLYPFYLVSGYSLTSTVVGSVAIHLLVLVLGVCILFKHTSLLRAWLLAWFLISIHPQFVIQQRYVWNPSFVGVSLLSAFFFAVLAQRTKNIHYLLGWSISVVLAIGFSYSAVPIAALLSLLPMLWLRGKQLVLTFILLLATGVILNAPMIFFEFRHDFLLTQQLLRFESLERISPSFADRLSSMRTLLFPFIQENLLLAVFLFLSISILVRYRADSTHFWHKLKNGNPALLAVSIFGVGSLLQLLLAVPLEAHYIFGPLTLAIVLIAFLPFRYQVVVLVFFVFQWLQPGVISARYFSPPPRTINQTTTCAAQVCEQFSSPTFVTIQSGSHQYHAAQDWRYLLSEAGCNVVPLTQATDVSTTTHMLVVADDSVYEHGKTQYHELTLFGPSKESNVMECQSNLRIHVLERVADN